MLTITAIKAFNDNYIWLLQQQPHSQVYVVDPGDAGVVIDYLEANRLTLAGILLTHHHRDHTGGVAELQAYNHNRLAVYGPDNETIEGITHPLHAKAQPKFTLDYLSAELHLLYVPGHTAGHIAYVIDDALFCGDTLFSGGCGRLFEGTPTQMLDSLKRLAHLPANTRVYCAHEYTLANLQFALTVNPSNAELQAYNERAKQLRSQDKPTIPSTIALERAINPFLHASDTEIVDSIKQHFSDLNPPQLDELASFTLLRQWKDNF
jgi:hydroxyacylglutathione hydrolase